MARRWSAALPLLLTALSPIVAAGCARLPEPELRAPAPWPIERPLVVVPGVTGTSLRDAATGEVVWGRGASLLRPRDGGYRLAPALDGADRLEPLAVIRRIRLAWFTKPVYQPVVDATVGVGYRLGNLEAPDPTDTLFLYAYDWRDDNVASARRLLELLESVRRVRDEDRLTVDLLCQSNGAHVCRWLAKYRALTLEEAERGAAPASRIEVGKLVLVGTSNGGALRILAALNRGRRYVPWIGRVFHPEVFFGMRSLYQDLPHEATDLFVDEEGGALEVDLYDPESWHRFGWSLFGPDVARRFARQGDPRGRFGTPEQRSLFLADALDRARRFQGLLATDGPAWGRSVAYLLENGGRPTVARAQLRRGAGGEWATLFPDDPLLARDAVRERLLAPGDGHATLDSQRLLSQQEAASLRPPRDIRGAHFEAIVERETLETLLEVLAEPLRPSG